VEVRQKKEVKLDRDEGESFLDEMAVAEVGGGVLPLADNGVQGDGCEDKTANLADLIWTLMTSTISRASAFPREGQSSLGHNGNQQCEMPLDPGELSIAGPCWW